MNKRKPRAPRSLDEKIIQNHIDLVEILKEKLEAIENSFEEVIEELTFSESREWFFFEFLEKNNLSVIDLYEFINEKKMAGGDDFFKKELLDNLLESHKMYLDLEGKENGKWKKISAQSYVRRNWGA